MEAKSRNIFKVLKPLLVGKLKAGHNPFKLFSVSLIQVGAVMGAFDAFRHPAGKHQAGGAVAFPAVGLGQILEKVYNVGLGHALKTGLDLIAVLPGRIYFTDQPF